MNKLEEMKKKKEQDELKKKQKDVKDMLIQQKQNDFFNARRKQERSYKISSMLTGGKAGTVSMAPRSEHARGEQK